MGRVSESSDEIATFNGAKAFYERTGSGTAAQAGQSSGPKQSLLRALVQRVKDNSSWIDIIQMVHKFH